MVLKIHVYLRQVCATNAFKNHKYPNRWRAGKLPWFRKTKKKGLQEKYGPVMNILRPRKAYYMFPQTWTIECLQMLKWSIKIINFITKSMEIWKVRGAFNMFPDFFVQAFKIGVDSWEFSMLLLYILWDDWPIFMISDSNQQLQQQLEYTLLKPDCHNWWISKMQSGREDTLEKCNLDVRTF